MICNKLYNNNGIADAVNASWKVAYALRGWAAGAGLLDSFTPERRGATLDVFRNAGKSSRFMTPPSRGYSLMRKAVLELALTEDFAKPFVDPRQVQPWIYDASQLTSPGVPGDVFPASPAPGAPLQNIHLGENDFLLDHIGPGFTVLYFADAADLDTVAAELMSTLRSIDPLLRVLVVAGEEGAAAVAADACLSDPAGHLADRYGAEPGTLYLVRPDRHIAGRWRQPDDCTVIAALRLALGELHEADT